MKVSKNMALIIGTEIESMAMEDIMMMEDGNQ